MPFFFIHRQNMTHKYPIKKLVQSNKIKKILAQAGGLGGDYLIPKEYFFFKLDILSFAMKIHCRI